MKSILLSIKPEWVAKILNGEKTIEVRKLFPKDYVGWVYLYCSKGKPLIKCSDSKWYIKDKDFEYDTTFSYYAGFNGKVVARFWCDKVDEITPYIWTPKLEQEILKGSCLTENELFKYISKNNGEQDNPFFAIHITKLEIFDRPRELSEFLIKDNSRKPEKFVAGNSKWEEYYVKKLTKAPQNYCYVECDN